MRRISGTVLLMALALCGPDPGAAGAGLAGRWRLEEQSRSERGAAAPVPAPQAFLVCSGAPGGPRCRLVAAGPPERAWDWPAFVTEAGALPVTVQARSIDEARGRLSARYRVAPVSADGQSLLVEEEYQVSASGESLEGTVAITLIHEGEERGTMRLRRRFSRQP